ncbi:MAG: AAA family ATPase [Gammaproteobacteria bacterium]
MENGTVFEFGPYRLDTVLRCDQTVIDLTPKAFRVLRMLLQNAPALVSKDELWSAVWPNVVVTDAALTVCIAELRKAVGDNARHPTFIATVPKRGYRFIGDVSARNGGSKSALRNRSDRTAQESSRFIVGRENELETIRQIAQRACATGHQILLISGEAGIGKTTLLKAAREDLETNHNVWAMNGQCIEHHGKSEAYLPLLDAIGRCCRGSRGAEVLSKLAVHAPLWLAEFSGLISEAEFDSVERRIRNASPGRMMRELSDVIEALCENDFVLLSIEDLHWSDTATLDWLAFIARGEADCHLLIIASYRDAAIHDPDNALREVVPELTSLANVTELRLKSLSAESTRMYIERRLGIWDKQDSHPESGMQRGLATLSTHVHRRTEGNPLFMRSLMDELEINRSRKNGAIDLDSIIRAIKSGAVPENLKQAISLQVDQVSARERELLEIASVAGDQFTSSVVTEVLTLSSDAAELALADLAREFQLIEAHGMITLPDGTFASKYAFKHSLYSELIYEQIAPGRVVKLHHAIGNYLRRAFEVRPAEIAAKLALHFERAREPLLSSHYCLLAGENSLHRAAYDEAISHFTNGLGLLNSNLTIDESQHRSLELDLLLAMGPALIATRGGGGKEVNRCYERAAELAQMLKEPVREFAALFGLRSNALARGDLETADILGNDLIQSASASDGEGLYLEANLAAGNTSFQRARILDAREHFTVALALFDPERDHDHAQVYGMDPGMFCRSFMAIIEEMLLNRDHANLLSDQALVHSRGLDDAFSIATAANFAAWLYQIRNDYATTEQHASIALEVSIKNDFASAAALAQIRRGWARALLGNMPDGINELVTGLAAWSEIGSVLGRPYFHCLHAEALARDGRPEEGLDMLNRAAADIEMTGECWPEPELYRLRGELLIAAGRELDLAKNAFDRARHIATTQRTPLFEKRARDALSEYFTVI